MYQDCLQEDDDTIKEEITEILISDTKKHLEPYVKKEVENANISNFYCLELSSEKYSKKHLADSLHEVPKECSLEGMPQFSVYNMYFTDNKYLDFMICNEENDHKSASMVEHLPLIGFKQDLVPIHVDINSDKIKEEIAEISTSDVKKYLEPNIKKEVENDLVCNFCCLEFSSEEYFKKHLVECLHEVSKEISSEGNTNKNYLDFMTSNEENDYKTANMVEDLPLIAYKEENVLPVHLDINDDTVKEEITEILISDTKKYLESNVKNEVENAYICNFCSLKFSSEKYLKEHLPKCLDEVPEECSTEGMVQCPVCNLYFPDTKKYLENHEKQCCGSLRKNLKRLEDGSVEKDAFDIEKRFTRTTFENPTNQKNDLEGQIQMHVVVKAHECTNYNKETIQKCNPKAHLRSSISEDPLEYGNLVEKDASGMEKKFQYSNCEYQTNNKGHFNDAHIRTYDDRKKQFECVICNKRFMQNRHLEKHLRSHTGDKPFQCEICNKTFAVNGNLKQHLVIHSGEKPFQCERCNKKFTQKSHLKRHLQIHGDEK